MFEFNDLLRKAGIDPASVIVMRHRPTERALRRALPWLAAERQELYNAYQSTHGEKVERALAKMPWLASFIGHEPGRALFVGMYRVRGTRQLTRASIRNNPALRELCELGSLPLGSARLPLWFDLELAPELSERKGRLVIDWPGIERSWWRRSERNVFPVRTISEESLLVRKVPEWMDLVLPWQELSVIPSGWRALMSQWRGVYFIFDRASGKGYVGSAYGAENILRRWSEYAKSGHGDNKLLRACDPNQLEFSILQLTAHDAPEKDVIALENSWKERLHTRAPFGLNKN